jgi:hypothetical protein
MSSRADTESKYTFNSGTNNTTSREPPDSSWNLTHPTPFTACMVLAPLLTCKSEPISKTMRNIDLILVIWWDDPLSMIHAPMSSHPVKLLLERKRPEKIPP